MKFPDEIWGLWCVDDQEWIPAWDSAGSPKLMFFSKADVEAGKAAQSEEYGYDDASVIAVRLDSVIGLAIPERLRRNANRN